MMCVYIQYNEASWGSWGVGYPQTSPCHREKGMFRVQVWGAAKSSFEVMLQVAKTATPNIPLSP